MLSSRYSKYQVGNPVCEAGLVIHKDGKTTNSGHTCQKFCCPFRQSKTGCYPCNHKSWNNGRKRDSGISQGKGEQICSTKMK